MKNFFKRIREFQEKKKYDVILQGRHNLTDYEKELLIPEIQAKLEALKQRFNEIIRLCEIQQSSREFSQNVHQIINPQGLPDAPGQNAGMIAEAFFSGIKAQAKKEGVDDIDAVLRQYQNIQNVKELGKFLTEVNILCSSLLVVKNTLFLFKIEAYPIATHTQTGEVINAQPNQYFVTTESFQIAINAILSIAKSTSDTISEWQKYVIKLKAEYLNLYVNRLTISNTKWAFFINFLTVLLAVCLSAFFLIANDPFNLLKKNRDLETKIMILDHENKLLKTEIKGQK